jgi:hypothetical protein
MQLLLYLSLLIRRMSTISPLSDQSFLDPLFKVTAHRSSVKKRRPMLGAFSKEQSRPV